jgi:hypothetical protein
LYTLTDAVRGVSGFLGCAGVGDDNALRQLQSDVCAADPSHYTRDGTRPVHYAVVLLLSLQFRRALNFLHVHPMCSGLRVTAPALALVVHAHSLTTLGGAGDLCGPAAGHAGLVNSIPATVSALHHFSIDLHVARKLIELERYQMELQLLALEALGTTDVR